MKSFLPFGFLLSFLFAHSPTFFFFFFGKSYKDSVKCAHNALSKKSIISLKHCQNNYFAFAVSWHHHPLAEQRECSPVRAPWSSRRPGCRPGPITLTVHSLSSPIRMGDQGPSPHCPLSPIPHQDGGQGPSPSLSTLSWPHQDGDQGPSPHCPLSPIPHQDGGQGPSPHCPLSPIPHQDWDQGPSPHCPLSPGPIRTGVRVLLLSPTGSLKNLFMLKL